MQTTSDSAFVRRAVIQRFSNFCTSEKALKSMYGSFEAMETGGLLWADWITLACTALEYRPDLVLELGRGGGSSTALFGFFGFRVVSVCRTRHWFDETLPMLLAGGYAVDWQTNINAITGEIGEQDYAALTAGAERVLLFWDAHGYDIADIVFGSILPALAGREVVVACHDIRDSRYFLEDREYRAQPLWRGQQEPYSRFVRLGNVHSSFEQLVSIVDFASRNSIELLSPTHELASDDAARSLVTDPQWPYCLWHYFVLPADRQLTFPAAPDRLGR